MAPSEAATPPCANQQARTASSHPPAPPAEKNFVTRDFDLVFRAFFPTPTAPAKFNPIHAMTQLFRTILKDEPSLVLRTPTNDQQIILASAPLPRGESEFKKYFKVSTSRVERQNKTQVCVGCHVLSNRSLGNIKHRSTDGPLLKWLKKERIFLDSDSLGIDRPVTIGHFTKIAPTITHLVNFREYLANQLMLVDIDAETAVKLAPHLKQTQLDAMSNGDDFVPILPDFEIYRTRITHGREPSQVSTDVLGIKCAPNDAKLLEEFFTRMAAATNNEQRDGVFIPKGAAHLLGPQTYEQVLRENNFFLTTVATIPVSLEYNAWFAVIDPNQTSDDAPISLHDHLIRKPWFLRIESVAKNKCFIVTTKNNLPEAREWVDANLEKMVRKSIPEGIDPPASLLPRRLDKPTYSESSHTYAAILKKQFTLTSTPTTPATANNRPPRKRQATLLEYDSDASATSPPTAVQTVVTNQSTSPQTPITTVDYAAELQLIKTELATLRTLINSAVEQMKSAVDSLTTHTPVPVLAREMEIEEAHDTDRSMATLPEISDLITELKNDIATIGTEMRDKFKELRDAQPKPIPFQLTPFPTFPT